jgi:hypothetical protein
LRGDRGLIVPFGRRNQNGGLQVPQIIIDAPLA